MTRHCAAAVGCPPAASLGPSPTPPDDTGERAEVGWMGEVSTCVWEFRVWREVRDVYVHKGRGVGGMGNSGKEI